MNKVQAFIRLGIMNFHMIVHVWQAYSMWDTNVRLMHTKALNHNMIMLQKQTTSCESFKNVKYMMVSNYKLLYLYFEVDYLQFLYLFWFMVFYSTFNDSYIVMVSFIGGRNRSIRRKPLTCCQSLTNFIT